MKDFYYSEADRANITLMGPLLTAADQFGTCYLVTSIWVQAGFRGRGGASRLLKQVCADADRESATLLLSIEPDGTGLGAEQLRAFYARNRFAKFGGSEWAMIRSPGRELES